MYSSIPLLALLAQSIYGAPFSVVDRAEPAALDLPSTTTTPITSGYDWTSGYVSEYPVGFRTNTPTYQPNSLNRFIRLAMQQNEIRSPKVSTKQYSWLSMLEITVCFFFPPLLLSLTCPSQRPRQHIRNLPEVFRQRLFWCCDWMVR